MKQIITQIITVIFGFFPIVGWSVDIRFVPGNNPFFGPDKHVLLYAYEEQLTVETPYMTFIQTGSKAGWCNTRQVCHGQTNRPDKLQISSNGKVIGFAVFNSSNQLTLYNSAENASLKFDFKKNDSYPSGPHSTTQVIYKGPAGKTGSFTYIHDPGMRAKCFVPPNTYQDETFSKVNTGKSSTCPDVVIELKKCPKGQQMNLFTRSCE